LEDGTLQIQEEEGYNISFRLGTGNDSVFESAEEEDN
jgi:hypothetical protein